MNEKLTYKGQTPKYIICHNPDFFEGKTYKLSYKLVLASALYRQYVNLCNNNLEQQVIKEKLLGYLTELRDLTKAVQARNNSGNMNSELKAFHEEKFVELYPLNNEKGKLGLVLIDRSGGCYPLVFYPDSLEKDSRLSALKKVLNILIEDEHFTKMFDFFEKFKSKQELTINQSFKVGFYKAVPE